MYYMLKHNQTCNRMGQNKKVKSIPGETEIMVKNYFFEKIVALWLKFHMFQLPEVKKDIHYEQCVKL